MHQCFALTFHLVFIRSSDSHSNRQWHELCRSRERTERASHNSESLMDSRNLLQLDFQSSSRFHPLWYVKTYYLHGEEDPQFSAAATETGCGWALNGLCVKLNPSMNSLSPMYQVIQMNCQWNPWNHLLPVISFSWEQNQIYHMVCLSPKVGTPALECAFSFKV